MRLAFALFILLSACGAKRSSGPAWPKMSEKETDGGESIAPRAKASAIAAAADTDDDDDDKDAAPAKSDDDDDKDDDETQSESDTPTAATSEATEPSEEIIITTEEIVIEIDDED